MKYFYKAVPVISSSKVASSHIRSIVPTIKSAVRAYLKKIGVPTNSFSCKVSDNAVRIQVDSINKCDQLADFIYDELEDFAIDVEVLDGNIVQITGQQNVTSSTFADSDRNWLNLDWNDQLADMKAYVKSYNGTRIFEDFAESVGLDPDDIIDMFCDAEEHGDIKISYEKQKDSEYANDDLYE